MRNFLLLAILVIPFKIRAEEIKWTHACMWDDGTVGCVITKEVGESFEIIVTNADIAQQLRDQMPGIAISAITEEQEYEMFQSRTISQGTSYSEKDQQEYEAAMDEHQLSGAACLATAAGCPLGLLGSIGASIRGSFRAAIGFFATGLAACLMTKPTCRDAIRKYKKFEELEKKREEALKYPNPSGGFGGDFDDSTALPDEDLHPTKDKGNCVMLPSTIVSSSEGDSIVRPGKEFCK